MRRILDITAKDLLQLLRDRKTFLFLLIMPVVFTFLFGYAFGGFGGAADARLPVGIQDADQTWLSRQLLNWLKDSQVIRLEDFSQQSYEQLQGAVVEEELAAAVIVPQGYSRKVLEGRSAKLILIGDTNSPAGMSIESEILTAIVRLQSATRIALILEQTVGERVPFDYAFEQAFSQWKEPPIRVVETASAAIQKQDNASLSLAHTSPGMMLQFAIAGLLTSAQILVSERRSRALQRLLTTATARSHILLGHFLAIFCLIFCQFILLILFGQFVLGVNYFGEPAGTLLVAFTSALCIAALGLLIGTLAKNEEQAIIFSLVPMFVLAGLGGAWVPLEVTGEAFRAVGHFSPVAWAMDGFKNISVRGLGLESLWLPALALTGYAVLFFALAVWRFRTE